MARRNVSKLCAFALTGLCAACTTMQAASWLGALTPVAQELGRLAPGRNRPVRHRESGR
jgi:hypothetical protein